MSALAIAKPAIVRGAGDEEKLPAAFASLKPLGARVKPLTAEDFFGRLQRAQELMSTTSVKCDALFVGPGSSLYYYTGIRWGLSERLMGLVLPKKGGCGKNCGLRPKCACGRKIRARRRSRRARWRNAESEADEWRWKKRCPSRFSRG